MMGISALKGCEVCLNPLLCLHALNVLKHHVKGT